MQTDLERGLKFGKTLKLERKGSLRGRNSYTIFSCLKFGSRFQPVFALYDSIIENGIVKLHCSTISTVFGHRSDMAPPHQRLNTLQRRWSNADGEKVGLWMSFGILTAFIFFTLLLGTLNIHLGKPIAKLRVLEDEKAVRENRVETLTQEADELRGQIARKTEENETAVRTRDNAERTYTTQRQLVQQQNDRIANLVRERDEKAEELRQRAAELAASRLFGTERARESDNLEKHSARSGGREDPPG